MRTAVAALWLPLASLATVVAVPAGRADAAETCGRIGDVGMKSVAVDARRDGHVEALRGFLAQHGLDAAQVRGSTDYGLTRFYAYGAGRGGLTIAVTPTPAGMVADALPPRPAAATVTTGEASSYLYVAGGRDRALRIGQNEPVPGSGSQTTVAMDDVPAETRTCLAGPGMPAALAPQR